MHIVSGSWNKSLYVNTPLVSSFMQSSWCEYYAMNIIIFLFDCHFTRTDINECLTGYHECQHVCKNTNGSFACTCHDGFILGMDAKTCQSKYATVYFFKLSYCYLYLILHTFWSFLTCDIWEYVCYIIIICSSVRMKKSHKIPLNPAVRTVLPLECIKST